MGRLENRTIIVTGAGLGLGKGYAKGLAHEGASIVVNDVSVDEATATVNEIKEAGGKAVTCVGAVGTKEVAQKLVETAVNAYGRLDVLVNNAGITRDSLMINMTEDQWDAVINVHLKGTFLNTQAAVRYMIEKGIKGRIINITSGSGIYGTIGQANYSAAKAGIIGLTKSNARELVRYGICVNVIAPAARTAMTESIPEKLRAQMYERIGKRNTLQRVGEPEDVVPMVIFLASEESYFVSGQLIEVMGAVGFETV